MTHETRAIADGPDDIVSLGDLVARIIDDDLRFRRLRLETQRKAGIDRWPLQVSRPRATSLQATTSSKVTPIRRRA